MPSINTETFYIFFKDSFGREKVSSYIRDVDNMSFDKDSDDREIGRSVNGARVLKYRSPIYNAHLKKLITIYPITLFNPLVPILYITEV